MIAIAALNILLAVTVTSAILSLLIWGIVSDRRTRSPQTSSTAPIPDHPRALQRAALRLPSAV